MPIASPLWRLTRPQDFHFRDWDDGGVVYDAASGETHLLDPLAMEVLALLLEAPSTPSDLATELGPNLPEDAQSRAGELIDQRLGQLARLRLAAATE